MFQSKKDTVYIILAGIFITNAIVAELIGGKLIQMGLIPLYQLAFNPELIDYIEALGIDFPNMCTRPVLYFNHPQLAKEEVYYKSPLHQDWPSMESSLNSLVVWVPLVDVNKENGSIIIYPGSHKQGVLPF